jgi:Fur family ferric uptake transcriptional regulator
MDLLIKKIQQSGLKATPSRVELLKNLYQSNSPQSYEDVKKNLSISIDKATFYRNMSAFEDKGFISSIESPDKRRYYEYRNIEHAHFICLECNNIECLKEDVISLDGYKIETITVKGYCPQCLKGI